MLCTIVGDLEQDDALLLVSFLMVSKVMCVGFYILISPMLSFQICG